MATNAPPYYPDNKKLNDNSDNVTNVRGSGFGRTVRKLSSVSDSVESSAGRFGRTFGVKSNSKATVKRSTGTKRLLTAFGAIPSSNRTSGGPGRPKGTYKYGIPIQQYKKLQSQRGALYKQYAQKQQNQLQARGFAPQQVQQLQMQRIQSSAQLQVPDTVQDEVEFQRFLAENTISPNSQAILDNLKRIQNKAITDEINQQRVHRERRIINEQQSLLKARNLFGPDSNKINIFDDANNILKAENRFSLDKQENVFSPTGRPNILQTAEAGNSFSAFTEERNILNAPSVFSLESSSPHRLRFF